MELQVEQTDIRIDQYLAQELDISRSKIQKLMKQEKITVNGKKVNSSYLVKIGDMIVVDDNLDFSITVDKENIPLDKQGALKIIQEAKEKGIGYLVAINDSQEVYGENDLFIQQVGYRKEPTTYILDRDFDYKQVENFYKIYLALDEKEEASFQNKDQLGSLRFEKEYLMFQPDNKKDGIFKMMEILQAPIQDVVVFGDDYNDLDMFDKDLWTGVAMGNACDALKEKATYITDKNVDDGIYNICEKMGWF